MEAVTAFWAIPIVVHVAVSAAATVTLISSATVVHGAMRTRADAPAENSKQNVTIAA
jgi:hypothetical protein